MLGISGGTTLGATAAALFPDRMDKVILDGVMNAHEYYHKSGYVQLSHALSVLGPLTPRQRTERARLIRRHLRGLRHRLLRQPHQVPPRLRLRLPRGNPLSRPRPLRQAQVRVLPRLPGDVPPAPPRLHHRQHPDPRHALPPGRVPEPLRRARGPPPGRPRAVGQGLPRADVDDRASAGRGRHGHPLRRQDPARGQAFRS